MGYKKLIWRPIPLPLAPQKTRAVAALAGRPSYGNAFAVCAAAACPPRRLDCRRLEVQPQRELPESPLVMLPAASQVAQAALLALNARHAATLQHIARQSGELRLPSS